MSIMGQLCTAACCLYTVIQADGTAFFRNIAGCVVEETKYGELLAGSWIFCSQMPTSNITTVGKSSLMSAVFQSPLAHIRIDLGPEHFLTKR